MDINLMTELKRRETALIKAYAADFQAKALRASEATLEAVLGVIEGFDALDAEDRTHYVFDTTTYAIARWSQCPELRGSTLELMLRSDHAQRSAVASDLTYYYPGGNT